MKSPPRRRWPWVLIALVLGLGCLVALGVGDALSRPARSRVGPPPAELGAVGVVLTTSSGLHLSGWFVPTVSARGAILLLHGVRADRRQMLGRVPFLRARGYSVLLIDLPSHGESEGSRITFGANEADGVAAGVAELRRRAPGLPVGVLGASMGAAAAVLAGSRAAADAMALESMYPTIEEATDDRLRNALGPLGPLVAPLLLIQLPMRAGVSPRDLHPIDAIRSVSCPIFILSGAEDRNTTPAETARIFEAVQSEKQLWIVPGAAHVDLHAYAGQDYERRVGAFFSSHLTKPALHAESTEPVPAPVPKRRGLA